MSDEDALLAAVIAHPDDDTPRLVYADWLDEHGQPDRAEFIRLQIEREQSFHSKGFSLVSSREAHLLGRRRKKWLQPIRELLPSSRYTFRRGFVEEIDTDTSLYLQASSDLHRVAPVRDVVLHRATDLCNLNYRECRPRVRLRVVVHEGWAGRPPTELDLLQLGPSELEPYVRVGTWIILLWAIWSVPDRGAVQNIGHALYLRRWPQVGIRPFDDYAELDVWCPRAPQYKSPLWLALRDGELITYHVGPDPPNEDHPFWDRLSSHR